MAIDSAAFRWTAVETVAALRQGEVSPLELIDAAYERIAATNGTINAMVTLCPDRARDHAKRLMQQPMAQRGILCGLPIAIKDLSDVAGVRTT